MDPLLSVRNLKKYFRTPHGWLHAVDDVSFDLNRGKTLGVVGESGCGKSTLGRLILNLIDITSGDVIFEGENIAGVKGKRLRELRRQMQIVFQDPFSSLNPRMTVSETIQEPFEIYGIHQSKKSMSADVFELMDVVGLARRYANSYPHEMDGGRRQRVGIARALSLNPKFIVCDEPVSSLDVSIQASILNLMQDLQDKKDLTYMFITHDLSVVKHISDEVLVLYLGQVVEKSTTQDLFLRQLHPYSKALLSAIPVPAIGGKKDRILLKGEISSPINPKPGCRFAPRCLHATERCTVETPELRELRHDRFVACHHAEVLEPDYLQD